MLSTENPKEMKAVNEQPQKDVKKCEYCGKPIKGREDKKYCNVDCKNNFNSRVRAEFRAGAHPNAPLILKAIKTNYEILLKHHLTGMEKDEAIQLEKSELVKKGFNDRFFTSIHTDSWGNQWKCCFDCAFREMENGQLELAHFPLQASL